MPTDPSHAPPRRGPLTGEVGPAGRPAISVVLPVYDEAQVLERNLAALVQFLETLRRSFEVVCVNDGSKDASARILDDAAARDPRIVVDHLAKNRGKGAAVRRGMQLARGDFQVFMDADLSTPLAELHGFLGALESGYDVVLGNRRSPGSRIDRRQPRLREWLGRGFTLITRTLLAPGVQDFTCGFKGFRRAASESIFARSSLDGWAFDAELVVIADVQGFKLVQVPVRWQHEDDTKVRLLNAVFGSAVELARIRFKRLRGDYR